MSGSCVLRSIGKQRVQQVKRLPIRYSSADWMRPVTDSQGAPAFAFCCKRSRCFSNFLPGLLAGNEAPVMNQFGLQGTPATFHRSLSEQLPSPSCPGCSSHTKPLGLLVSWSLGRLPHSPLRLHQFDCLRPKPRRVYPLRYVFRYSSVRHILRIHGPVPWHGSTLTVRHESVACAVGSPAC